MMRKAKQEKAAAMAAAEAAGSAFVEAPAAGSSRYRFLPSRQSTIGDESVKDSTGGEVIGDRVLLYIHGKHHPYFPGEGLVADE